MKWMQWDKGRQDGRYHKLLLATSKYFKFDCYLLQIPDGCAIMRHVDPAVEGYEHHRVNIFLNRFGWFRDNLEVDGPCKKWWGGRIMKFRPDLYLHGMRHINQYCSGDNTYILTFGWLKKKEV